MIALLLLFAFMPFQRPADQPRKDLQLSAPGPSPTGGHAGAETEEALP